MLPVIKLAFLDVGQGDTTVISCPDTQEAIVVDCADSEAVIEYFEREQIKHLRGVIITHLHADHYKQTADLLYGCEKMVGMQGCEILATTEAVPKAPTPERYPPDDDKHSTAADLPLVGKGRTKSSASSLSKLYDWCKNNQAKCQPILANPNVALPIQGKVTQGLQVLHPPFFTSALRASGLNNISVVLRIEGPGASALLAADLEPEGWAYLKGQAAKLESNVLRFPHHGGAWEEEETDDLLDIVHPSTVIISVGSNNAFDHPRKEVFASFKKRHDLRLLCTQATDKCQASVLNNRKSVVAAFKNQRTKDHSFFRLRKNQCPCAGTVIIELRDRPYILQPETYFHESLIATHYQSHQCSLHTILSPTVIPATSSPTAASSTVVSSEMTAGSPDD